MIERDFCVLQGRSRTSASGRSASGGLHGQTNSHATTASTPAPNPSAAPSANAPSRAAITSRCTWSGTCPRRPSELSTVWHTSLPPTPRPLHKSVVLWSETLCDFLRDVLEVREVLRPLTFTPPPLSSCEFGWGFFSLPLFYTPLV